MTVEDVSKMPIEEIIHLPNFLSLRGHDWKEYSFGRDIFMMPYWEITFRGEALNDGSRMFECFGSKSIFQTFVIHKYKE